MPLVYIIVRKHGVCPRNPIRKGKASRRRTERIKDPRPTIVVVFFPCVGLVYTHAPESPCQRRDSASFPLVVSAGKAPAIEMKKWRLFFHKAAEKTTMALRLNASSAATKALSGWRAWYCNAAFCLD